MKKSKLIIGKSGSGKTERLKSLAENAIQLGHSVCIIESSFREETTPIFEFLKTKGIEPISSFLLEVIFLDEFESNPPVCVFTFDEDTFLSRQDLTGPLNEIFSKFDVILIDGMAGLLTPFIRNDEQDKLIERLLNFNKELYITTQVAEELQFSESIFEEFKIIKVDRDGR